MHASPHPQSTGADSAVRATGLRLLLTTRMRTDAGLQKALARVPSAVFEKGVPGVREYSVGARFACVGVKFLEYSLAGMVCGLVGQGIANSAMMARRASNPDADFSVDPPPLLKTALVWGLFMGASSNLRYQAVFGLERLVDGTIARRIPQVCPFLDVAALLVIVIACPLVWQ